MKAKRVRKKTAAVRRSWRAEASELKRRLRQQAEDLSVQAACTERLLAWQDELQTELQNLGTDGAGHGSDSERAAPPAYRELVRRIREAVRRHLPLGAVVAVVSKGDPALLRLGARKGWHFPGDAAGQYAGYHPACSLAAIAQVEAIRARGAGYLLFPEPAFWWLDHYAAFRRHLEDSYPCILQHLDTCIVYALHSDPPKPAFAAQTFLAGVTDEFRSRYACEPAVLDYRSGLTPSQLAAGETVFVPPDPAGPLPYLDRSVDIVIADGNDPAAVGEARRVASGAVVTVTATANGTTPGLDVEWAVSPSGQRATPVSVVIPCFDGWAMTEACLRSLAEKLSPGVEAEIIVVDDASSDETARELRRWARKDSRLRVLRNRRNRGFVDTCNRGARAAQGEFLVFLNNDTLPLPGWLSALLGTFRLFPDAGAVGGKLIFPDGTLQEAGGLVFADGSAANFGRNAADLEAPVFNYVREVDYCSAALLATPRALFREMGGFDAAYAPGYYEDTDYCFRLRRGGWRVYYQPASAVVHREGGTAGTDLSVGMKRHQLLNQGRFLATWREVLARHPSRPLQFDTATRHRLSGWSASRAQAEMA